MFHYETVCALITKSTCFCVSSRIKPFVRLNEGWQGFSELKGWIISPPHPSLVIMMAQEEVDGKVLREGNKEVKGRREIK